MNRVEHIELRGPLRFPEALNGRSTPAVIKGLVSDWPLVEAAARSNKDADRYLRRFYNGNPVTISAGAPEIRGRVFYEPDLANLNFETRRGFLVDVLDEIETSADSDAPALRYVGSTAVDTILPGFRDENDLDFDEVEPSIRIWIGNRTCIAAHFDIPDNIACVAAGRRRFTLFPPDQLKNLYIGPLDVTPAGQPISLVDLHDPDLQSYPRFRQALDHAIVADLEPGDGIFVPSMWWHHVDGLDSLNVLVNYWWRKEPAYLATPLDALNHAFLAIRDLPAEQRQIWRDVFDHYIFAAEEDVVSHIPERARGRLSKLTDETSRRLRALLIRNLNR